MTCCVCDCDEMCCVCSCERRPATDIVEGLTTTAQKIGALFRAGYGRDEISKRLGIPRQDVDAELDLEGFDETRLSEPLDCDCSCERRPMAEIIEGLATTADRIRALFRAGYSRAQIGTHLGIRYQHVRNVLLRSGFEEIQLSCVCPCEQPPTADDRPPDQVRTTIGPGGRVVIPAQYRAALAIKEGDAVFMRLDGEELRVVSDATEVQRVREMIAGYVPESESVVDELILERRREAEAEESP